MNTLVFDGKLLSVECCLETKKPPWRQTTVWRHSGHHRIYRSKDERCEFAARWDPRAVLALRARQDYKLTSLGASGGINLACVSSETHNLQPVFLRTLGGHCARRSLRRPWKLGLRILISKTATSCDEHAAVSAFLQAKLNAAVSAFLSFIKQWHDVKVSSSKHEGHKLPER